MAAQGFRNVIRALYIWLGACSATQWPAPLMTAVRTSVAAGVMPSAAAAPQLFSPPIPRTGMVSGVFCRSRF